MPAALSCDLLKTSKRAFFFFFAIQSISPIQSNVICMACVGLSCLAPQGIIVQTGTFCLIKHFNKPHLQGLADRDVQVWANCGPGAICGTLSLMGGSELEEKTLIVSK